MNLLEPPQDQAFNQSAFVSYFFEIKVVYFFVPLRNLFLDNIIPTKSSDFTFSVNRAHQFNTISLYFSQPQEHGSELQIK